MKKILLSALLAIVALPALAQTTVIGVPASSVPTIPFVLSGTAANLLSIQDPTAGQGSQSNIVTAIQPQNYYALSATYNALGNMLSGSGNTPTQLRVILNGDSTTGFHNAFVLCALETKFGVLGFDFGGVGGVQAGFGQPCGSGPGQGLQTQNATSGTITQNNGAGSIVPGTGAPYDFTRSPSGSVWNIGSGGSITFGAGGSSAYGNVLKVYYLKEPTDGISGAAPGTMTVTATSSAAGPCAAGCVIATIALSNASSLGGVVYQRYTTPDAWTLQVAASGGAIDVLSTGIYDDTHSGIVVSGGTGRGGLSIADSTTTPAAIINPWFASAAGKPLAITAYSCSGTTGTFTAVNSLQAGQKVLLGKFPTSTFLNSTSVTVSSATGSQFVGTNTNGCSGSLAATENGYGLTSSSNALIMAEWKDNGIGTGAPLCQMATAAAPTTFQTYTYWMTQYLNQWKLGSPLADFDYTGSYDINDACIPKMNDQVRALFQTSGYFYYDNYFPETYATLEARGQLSNSVHSAASEQIANSINLWNQMGLAGSFVGAEGRDVASKNATATNFWLGPNNPLTSVFGMCATSPCTNGADLHIYGDASNHVNVDVTNEFNMYDPTHTNPFFCVNLVGAGVNPTNCIVQVQNSGTTFTATSGTVPAVVTGAGAGTELQVNNTGTGNATLQLKGTVGIVAERLFSGATEQWRVGMNSNTNWTLADQRNSRNILTLPVNTMPANSYGGNANGPVLLTVQTATNCAVNSVSPAACAAAASGAIVVPTTTTTYTVNTTAVTAASRIFLFPMTFASNLPSTPTCVAPAVTSAVSISAITAGTSFTFALPSTSGQTCWSYEIVN